MSDPAGPNGWDIAAIAGGLLAVLSALGKAGAWLLAWGDRRTQARADRLAREEGELAESWSAFRKRLNVELHEAKAEIVELKRRDIERAKENAAMRVAFELVAGALRVINPGNIALRQAEQVLAAVFPLTPQLPLDMTNALASLDAAEIVPSEPEGEGL